MLRDGGNGNSKGLRQFAGRLFSILQKDEDRSPGRMRNRAEDIIFLNNRHISLFPFGVESAKFFESWHPAWQRRLPQLSFQPIEQHVRARSETTGRLLGESPVSHGQQGVAPLRNQFISEN